MGGGGEGKGIVALCGRGANKTARDKCYGTFSGASRRRDRGAWSVETMLGTQVEKKGGEELRVAKNRGRREKGGQITKMGYIETWTKRRGGGLDKRRGGEKMKLCTLVSVYKVAEQ